MSLKGVAFLIDITEERFKIPANHAVIEYIRRENPFAHSDLGDKLIKLAKRIPNTLYYCPSFASCAYVVLHTNANVIFAIALGMLSIEFRLPAAVVIDAVANGNGKTAPIGDDWLSVSPFPKDLAASANDARLLQWCTAAHTYAEVLATTGQ
jgi:hypothetical protein